MFTFNVEVKSGQIQMSEFISLLTQLCLGDFMIGQNHLQK